VLSPIHEALASLLRGRGQIDPLDVDVSFEVPVEQWVGSLIRPTVDFFLFDLAENTDRRETSPQVSINNGRAERRMPPRRIDLWYVVSVLTTEVADEHELLWRVLATLLKHEQIPAEVLPETLRFQDVQLRGRLAGSTESRNLLDVWSALGTRPRPALCYVLTAPLDLALSIDAPLVLSRTARYRQTGAGAQPRKVTTHIGGIVSDASGRAVPSVQIVVRGSASGVRTDPEGRYALHGLPEGRLALSVIREGEALKEVVFDVPSASYDIVLDG
jgi:hypothetical protein